MHAPDAPPMAQMDVAMDAGGMAEMSEAPMAPPSPGAQAPAPMAQASMAAAVPGAPGQVPMTPTPQRAPATPAGKAAAPSLAPSKAKQVDAAEVRSARSGVEQLLIFTGRLDLSVDEKDFGTTLHEVTDLAAKRGGYIHQQNDHSVTVRIPSARFRGTMRDLEKMGEVVHRSVQAQDVTDKYYDLGVRLKSLMATRDRLQKFLDRAKTIDEVLRVEQELRRLNTEIDQLEGQRRYLGAQAAYSTITIALTPKLKEQVIVEKVEEEKDIEPPPPPPPKTVSLPIDWLTEVSLERLLQLGN
jgi:Domain of unknown function (DUF4349)